MSDDSGYQRKFHPSTSYWNGKTVIYLFLNKLNYNFQYECIKIKNNGLRI